MRQSQWRHVITFIITTDSLEQHTFHLFVHFLRFLDYLSQIVEQHLVKLLLACFSIKYLLRRYEFFEHEERIVEGGIELL